MLIEKKRSKIFLIIDQLEYCFQINKQNQNPNASKQSVQLNQKVREIGINDDGDGSNANKDQEEHIQNERELKSQIFEEVNDFWQILQRVKTNVNEIKRAIYQPIPQGYRAFCVLKKNKSLLSSNFQLFFEDEDQPIMFGEKVYGIQGSNYLFDLTKRINKTQSTFLGKLKGNAMGSRYSLYTAGDYPQKDNNRKQWRIWMGRIEYETNFLGLNGPRKITVSLPKVQSIQQFDRFKLNQKECNEIFKSSFVRQFRNKNPCWAQVVKSYVLDFRGRVKIGSIRNFLLIPSQTKEEAEDETNESILFGKINENTFIMEVSYPISLFQAFAIAVSQFDFKFNCQ